MRKNHKIYILDTSAILSGKPINFNEAEIVTTSKVSDELTPGGRDYQNFQFLKEKGLSILSPNKDTLEEVQKVSNKTGDQYRLSKTDIEIIALALDLQKDKNKEVIILTDDYSIQNLSNELKIKFESISQPGITKRFKWGSRCRGCGKRFKDNVKICPICGAETNSIISNKKIIRFRSDKE